MLDYSIQNFPRCFFNLGIMSAYQVLVMLVSGKPLPGIRPHQVQAQCNGHFFGNG